jgi:hypothetical protein
MPWQLRCLRKPPLLRVPKAGALAVSETTAPAEVEGFAPSELEALDDADPQSTAGGGAEEGESGVDESAGEEVADQPT